MCIRMGHAQIDNLRHESYECVYRAVVNPIHYCSKCKCQQHNQWVVERSLVLSTPEYNGWFDAHTHCDG